MGLDTTHDCWHGPYSSFNDWRRAVAKAVGIHLDHMQGFYDPADGPRRPPGAIPRKLPIRWDSLPPDVLFVLLHHSDCDGDIPAAYCAPLADRLEELLPRLPDDDSLWPQFTTRGRAQQWINGLRLAASRGEAVEFH